MKSFILLSLLASVLFASTQNLVPNSSFEKNSHCPYDAGQIEFATGWFKTKVRSSSDLYNVCGSSEYSIPSNGGGYQDAKEGNAYAGVYLYHKIIADFRHYITIKLISPLHSEFSYKVSFYVSLADTSKYGICNISAFLSDFNPETNSTKALDFYQPQVNNSGNRFLINYNGWEKITAIYKAVGGEEYITIGNFFPDSLTDYLLVNKTTNQPHAYYYIDDVSVTKLPDQDISMDSISISSTCHTKNSFLQLHFSNKGAYALDFTEDTVTFSTEVKVNGKVVQNFEIELNDNKNNPIPGTSLEPDSSMSIQIGPVDLSAFGNTYQITVSSFFKRDSNNTNDTLIFNIVPERQADCFEIQVPNIFTPNGDGINDYFIIGNSEGKQLSVTIFNRWGEEVANFDGKESWDGGSLPAGIYYYVISELKDNKVHKKHTGQLTIVK